jgi:hypothetical protein
VDHAPRPAAPSAAPSAGPSRARRRRRPGRSRLAGVAVALCLALVAAACSGDDDDSGASDTTGGATSTSAATTSTTRRSTTTVTAAPQQLAPLTGLPYGILQNPDRPALMVKTDGAREAEPQLGLDVADVVYEEPVEGLIRYIAVFHSRDPGDVGPVRSARPMDANIIAPLHGLFAISGGIGTFVQAAQDVSRVFLEGNEAYHRDSERRAPHNLMGNAVDLWNQADGETTPPPLWDFADAPPRASAVCTITLAYNSNISVRYDLDPPTGTWKRSLNGEPQMSASGTQIAPNNVVVQLTEVESTQFVDVTGSRVVETIVIGSGDAYVMAGGQAILSRWDHPEAAQPTTFTDQSGQRVQFQRGSTWVHLLPVGSDLKLDRCPDGTPGPTTTTTGGSSTGASTTRAGAAVTTRAAATTVGR